MNIKKLFSRQIIKKIHGIDNYNPNIKKIKYKEKIGKSEEIRNLVKSILLNKNKGKTLLNAPTSSGKTYLMSEVFDELIETSKLLKDKNIDIENTCYVLLCPNKIQNEQNKKYGFKALVKGEFLSYDNLKVSAVYEKVKEIIDMKETLNDKIRIVMVVDEAHQMIDAIQYRSEALNSIFELEQLADQVVYMTATPDNLQCMVFDNIYIFKDETYKGNSKKINIIKTNNVKEFISKEINKQEYGVFALSSKDFILEKEAELRALDIKSNILISDDNHKTMEYEPYRLIIEEEKLLPYRTLVSSMFYAGTNVKHFNEDTIPYFACLESIVMNIDNIEQFFNRFRGVLKEANIVIGDKLKMTEEEDGTLRPTKFRSLELICQSELITINKYKKSFELMVEALKLRTSNKAYILRTVKEDLLQTINGRKNHLNCLDIDKNLNIIFNYITFFKDVYYKYQNQFYYFPEMLEKELKIRFGNVETEIKEVEVLISKKEKNDKKEKREIEMLKTKKLISDLRYNNLFLNYINGKIGSDKAEKNEDIKKVLKQKKLVNKLKDIVNINVDVQYAIDFILNIEKYVEVDKFILQENIINNNRNFKLKKEALLAGTFGAIQKFILRSFKLKDVITDTKVKILCENIKKDFKIDYNDKKMKYLLECIYNIDSRNRITSLKTKSIKKAIFIEETQDLLKDLALDNNETLKDYVNGKINSTKAREDISVDNLIKQDRLISRLIVLVKKGIDYDKAINFITNVSKYSIIDNYIKTL